MSANPPLTLPGVSVVLPVLNEERDLAAAVNRVLQQRYDGPYEVVLAVGPSTDRTLEIAEELAAADPRVRVVTNPTGRTPAGLNVAIKAAKHDILVRVDGHSIIPPSYVTDVVRLLGETGASNVGGMMIPEGFTPFSHAVARAMSSALGIGSAPIHTGGNPGPTETVYLGSFTREALESIGGFDERFTRAQDWELNYRLRQAGHVVWFDPDLRVGYRPRDNWRALARQFFRTGRWRRHVIRLYPQTAALRYLAPPATVAALAVGALAGVVGAVGAGVAGGFWPWLLLGWAAPAGYAVVVLGGAAWVGRGLPWRAKLALPVVIATMHLAWGSGFLLPARDDRPN